MSFNINRRQFLQTSAGALAVAALGADGAEVVNPARPYRVALIGCGWYGKSDLFRLIQVAPVEVVGLCDPDKQFLAEAAKMVAERQKGKKEPPTYADHQEMLAKERPEVVLVGSPDHWHALHAIDALRAGAHCYVQKPISRDVIEGEAMLAAARKHNRVVQIGTQRKSTPHLIDVKREVVEAGLLGKIGHVECCCYYHMRANGNPPEQPVPAHFDYERWTGPAPLRPFDGMPHLRWWRTFMEYGNGILGDMCVHMYDTVRWMLKLGWPKKVTSHGGILVQKEGKSNIPDTQTATFEHPEFNVTWTHRSWGTSPDPDYPWALFIYGEKGTLKASTMRADFVPQGRDGKARRYDVLYEKEQYPEDVTEKGIELNAAPATRRHMLDFLNAIAKGTRPVADIEEGHISTASCILAMQSMALGGRPLAYDPARRVVPGDDEATKLLRKEYRKPYVHPEVE